MKRSLILIVCAFPTIAMAATQHSTEYYFKHPDARVALEIHCYPGAGTTITADNCRNAWQAGRRIVQSLVKAPTSDTGWAAVEQSAARAAGNPLYPHAPEEQRTNPVYWRLRGVRKIKNYTFYCPAHTTDARPTCTAAAEALADPWHPTQGGR